VDQIDERVARSFARQGFMRNLGARLVAASGGRCVIEADWAESLTQQHGFFHAGVTASLADSAAGYAAFSLMPPDASVLTVEYKINLLNPAQGERLRATATVIKPGRTLMVTRASVEAIRDGQATQCAEFLATVFVLAGKPDDASFKGS
jgi:uncharacterized protein (TIGR00369 family)